MSLARRFAVVVTVGLAALAGVPVAAAAGPPAPALVITALKADAGALHFVMTPRNVITPFIPSAVRVSIGSSPLSSSTSAATTDIAPRAVFVVIDTGTDMTTPQLVRAQTTVRLLAMNLPDDVRVGLAVTGNGPTIRLRPTLDRAAVVDALKPLVTGGPDRLLDAVGTTRVAFDGAGLPAAAERRIVLIGTGSDSGSALTAAAAVTRLSSAGIIVDAIVNPPASGPPSPAAAVALTKGTGGRALTAFDDSSASDAANTEGSALSPAVLVAVDVPAPLAGTAVQLTVAVVGTDLSVTLPVTFGGVRRAAAAPSAPAPPPAAPSWLPTALLYVAAGAGLLGLGAAAWALIWPRRVRPDRLDQIAGFGPARKPTSADPARSVTSTSTAERRP